MRTLAETTLLLHRARPPLAGLDEKDHLLALGWIEDVLRDLEGLHRRGEWHGGVCPEAVRIGPRGAKLMPPGSCPPPEYRDPERARFTMKDDGFARTAEPRHDLYGVGAALFCVADGGAPPCGPRSRLTRPTPDVMAYVASRAMAEGAVRYPTAEAMREDVVRARRLAKRGGIASVRPEDLPSFEGAAAFEPRRLEPFEVKQRRGRRAMRVFVLSILAVSAIAWILRFAGDEPVEAAREEPGRAGLAALVEEWRGRIDERLAAAGETLDPASVPLLLVADAPVPEDLGWMRHPSERLTRAVRAVLRDGVPPGAVQRALLDHVGADTLPAVLWVTVGPRRGTLRARLYYRGIAFDDVVARARP